MHSVVADSNGTFPIFASANFGNRFSLSKEERGDTVVRSWIAIHSDRTDVKVEISAVIPPSRALSAFGVALLISYAPPYELQTLFCFSKYVFSHRSHRLRNGQT